MDLVSFESQQEYDWVRGFIDSGVKFFWTSGRKCNFDGCDKPEFFPKLINGWFWSANQVKTPVPVGEALHCHFTSLNCTVSLHPCTLHQVKMPPANGNQFHDWSHTGGSVLDNTGSI